MTEPTTMVALMGWAVRVKRADLHAARRGDPGRSAAELQSSLGRLSLSGTAQAARTAQLGTRVDTSAIPLRVDLDPDAEAVFLAAEAELQPTAFGLIVRYAGIAELPDWGGGIERWRTRPEMVWAKRQEAGPTLLDGQVQQQAAGEGYWPRIRRAGGRGGRSAPYCSVIYQDSGDVIEAQRQRWLTWWQGLADLLDLIEGRPIRLRRWRVVGVGAQQKPWVS